MSITVPKTITRDEFLAASKPLFDLLGVTGMQIFPEFHFSDDILTMAVVVHEEGHSDDPIPAMVQLASEPQEFAPVMWLTHTRVVDE